MNHVLIVLAAAAFWSCTAASPRPLTPRPLTELPLAYDDLQGVWVVTLAERGGEPMHDKLGSVMHFEGNKFWFTGDTGFETIVLDPGTEPAHIDFQSTGSAVRGLYRIEGDTLVVCSAPPWLPRPTRLACDEHPLHILTRSRRES